MLNNTGVEKDITVTAYPNPFNDKVNFVLNVNKAGTGVLELFNILGQKVTTIFEGDIKSGTNTFEISLPDNYSGSLMYKFTMGDQLVTGNLIKTKK